jgi:hypothetical protein
MTALAGIVPIQIGNQKSVIEVVRQIPGVSSEGNEQAEGVPVVCNGERARDALLHQPLSEVCRWRSSPALGSK